VLTRKQLLLAGWGESIHVQERTVDRHVAGLRKKLGAAAAALSAVPGEGYRWSSDP
jgi:DNA-binding response OmpR family regulator